MLRENEIIDIMTNAFCTGWDAAKNNPEQERKSGDEVREVVESLWIANKAKLTGIVQDSAD